MRGEAATEKDLFGPIKGYFEAMGYTCDGEVKDIDLYMEKDGESIAVELKVSLDFKALQQAALRQKVADTVFIGTFTPKNMFSSAWRDKLYLLKRLGIGLILVSARSGAVSIANEPIVRDLSEFRSRSKKKKEAVKAEFAHRKVKNNTGGVTGAKLITGYREDALLVLDALCSLGGEAATHDIRLQSGIEKTAAILRGNPYKWFHKTGRGRYSITEEGYNALEEFESVLKALIISP